MAAKTRRKGPTKKAMRASARKVTAARKKAKTHIQKAATHLVAHHEADKKVTKLARKHQSRRTAACAAKVSKAKKCNCAKCRRGGR